MTTRPGPVPKLVKPKKCSMVLDEPARGRLARLARFERESASEVVRRALAMRERELMRAEGADART